MRARKKKWKNNQRSKLCMYYVFLFFFCANDLNRPRKGVERRAGVHMWLAESSWLELEIAVCIRCAFGYRKCYSKWWR